MIPEIEVIPHNEEDAEYAKAYERVLGYIAERHEDEIAERVANYMIRRMAPSDSSAPCLLDVIYPNIAVRL